MLSYYIKNVKISFWSEHACQERIGAVFPKLSMQGLSPGWFLSAKTISEKLSIAVLLPLYSKEI